MPRCHTDCVERPLSQCFGALGRCVGRHPLWFLLVPLVLSASLGSGFIFLGEMRGRASSIEDQFTPVDGAAKRERLVVQTNFPREQDGPGQRFSSQRLITEGTYGSLIVTSTSDNILTDDAFGKILKINNKILEMEVENHQNFSTLCAFNGAQCLTNAILELSDTGTPGFPNIIHYPMNNGVFLGTSVGGVQFMNQTSNQIKSARAVRLIYFLREEDNATLNSLWLNKFIITASQMKETEVDVSYFTSLSREEEFENSAKSITPLFSVTYALAINFSIWSCMRLDCVRNKVWVAAFGVLSAGMAVLSSFGLLLYLEIPFSMTVASAPFLILGIGVDDMFIMISCWQQTKVKNTVEERMATAYRDGAVSITITTLTDAAAFALGLLTPFRSVWAFCAYTGTAVLFCFLYSLTFFGAFLALNGRREASNRHWFTCQKVQEPGESASRSKLSSMCCLGGVYDQVTGTEKPLPVNSFFEKFYGPFLTKGWVKVCVVLLYAGYLATSVYGCFQMKEGIDLKNLASDDSYLGHYYDDIDEYFSQYGPSVMVVLNNRDFKYWDKSAQDQLERCLETFESLTFENKSLVDRQLTISWLRFYLLFGKSRNLNLTDKRTFGDNLSGFLKSPSTNLLRQDVNFSVPELKIYASRMFIQTVNINTANDEKNLLYLLRETAKSEVCPQPLEVYHPAFIYFDQYAVIVSNTIQNLLLATLVMLVVSLTLIPNPICSLWVTFAIASIIIGVSGFMAMWDVNLDSVSMINLIICVGFSVDFSAHISYAFISSPKPTANEKAVDALVRLGYPILQGALSTILGVVVLSVSVSYIFRTFFKIMTLVICFGALHGLVFLPVFLTLCGVCGGKVQDQKGNQEGVLDGKDTSKNTRSSTESRGMTGSPGESKCSKSSEANILIRNNAFDPDCHED